MCAVTSSGNPHNNHYPNPRHITDQADLRLVARLDHVAATYTGDRRSSASFVSSDCVVMDIDNDTIREALSSFKPVEHRLEKVLSVGGVLYINDSKATNVDSAWYALECQSQPVVWIVGGTDKGNDYSSLVPLAKEKVKAMICMGLDNGKFHSSFEGVVPEIYDVTSAHDAVQMASRLAKNGDVVLLSPCCASFDLFKNYEDRGEQFKEEVRKL